MPTLRPELLHFARDDGGVDIVDLLFEQLVTLSAAEARGLARRDERVMTRLASLSLCEGPAVDEMRFMAWASRAHVAPRPAPAPAVRRVDWGLARALPPLISRAWREPERYRRLAEERLAGRRYLSLPGFLTVRAARDLRRAVVALPFVRLGGARVQADRKLLAPAELAEWHALMAMPALRRLLGAVLGVSLPRRHYVNAWRMRGADHFGVHPDGRRYRGTLALGLCEGWTASDGGAIAFGDPTADGFAVRERWLPHLGDALVFAPAADTWHAVEPTLSAKTRYTLTGWWSA